MRETTTPSSISAKVRYLNSEWRGREELAEIGSRETRRANTSFREVTIEDARPLAQRGALDLDTTGFVITRHRSALGDFHDDVGIRRTYYPEIESVITRLTGADRVVFLGHQVRTENPKSFNDAYARFIHNDYGVGRTRELSEAALAAQGVALEVGRRWEYAWYNTWQPVDREVQKNPLTLIDATSVAEADLVEYLYTGFGVPSRSTMATFNPAHRFYYFPRMQTDEVIVIKQLDSRSGRATQCPHTSFDDATSAPDALGRRNVEVRMICAFAEDL